MNANQAVNNILPLLGHDAQGPYLKGARCGSCQAVFFPFRAVCPHCTGSQIESAVLSRSGRLYSYTTVYHKPPDYNGEVPYVIGRVRLSEGVFVLAQIKASQDRLKIDMPMELVLETIYSDENGNEIEGYKFKPTEE